MKRLRTFCAVLTIVLPGCGRDALPAADPDAPQLSDVRASLGVLAHDSMLGRGTGTAGSARAARFIAEEMAALGLEPGGDEGFLQSVPVARVVVDGRSFLAPIGAASAVDTVPPGILFTDANVVGIVRGVDPELRHEAVVVGAHYDHLGVGRPAGRDSVYNGADDNASGVVAVLEIARALKAGSPPRRTVVFIAFTGEEMGGLGSVHYLSNPVMPVDRTVAQLNIEMIGRPDPLAGGRGRAWLTGYDRSTMGELLEQEGLAVVPDPRPDQSFFERSDNIVFALQGIPAHTLSSFNLHEDYHRPSDETRHVDFRHLTEVIRTAARAVRILADGTAPTWKPGGQPVAH